MSYFEHELRCRRNYRTTSTWLNRTRDQPRRVDERVHERAEAERDTDEPDVLTFVSHSPDRQVFRSINNRDATYTLASFRFDQIFNNCTLVCFVTTARYQIEMMDQRDRSCPCGCPGAPFHDETSMKIKTKEIVTRPGQNHSGTDVVERVFPLDMLRYQGNHYCAVDISPLWKKDCRMWLWKTAEKSKEKRAEKP